MLVTEKGKIVKWVDIKLPDGKVIKPLQKGESYKYLGILEGDKFLEKKMKLNVSKEFIRRLRKDLQSFADYIYLEKKEEEVWYPLRIFLS